MRWRRHILKEIGERTSKKVLNLEVKGESLREKRRSRWEEQFRKAVTHRDGRPWVESREEEELLVE
jgi:hypothetical protein